VRLQPQQRPREQAAAARDDASHDPPVDGPAALHVARADDEVRRVPDDGRDERREHRRIVAEVGIHLDDDARAAVEGGAEPVEVRPAEALLAGAMADTDLRVGCRQLVGQAARAIRRVVVDDEQGRTGERGSDRFGDRADVLGLVVGREDDPRAVPEPRVGDGHAVLRWR
jgi:hypothetical protein